MGESVEANAGGGGAAPAELAELLTKGDVGAVENLGAPLLAKALLFEHRTGRILANMVARSHAKLVSRDLVEYEPVLTATSREFWHKQLMANRDEALPALAEWARGKAAGGAPSAAGSEPQGADSAGGVAGGGGAVGGAGDVPGAGGAAGAAKRPMHNRATARPVVPVGPEVAGAAGADGGDAGVRAAKLRNRAQAIAVAEGIPFMKAFRRAENETGA